MDGFTYKGPMDPVNRGCPLLSKGFFNIKCDEGLMIKYSGYAFSYNNYFNGTMMTPFVTYIKI